MNKNDETKVNILKRVNKKIQRRERKIVLVTVLICLMIGIAVYFSLFKLRTPLIGETFKNVRIETKLETIGELDNRELEYSHLCFDVNELYWYNKMEFYIENNKENTSTLYFYMSESNIEKIKNKNIDDQIHEKNNVINCNILLYPKLCKTDKINEITKVCYLVYDYENMNKEEFNKAKASAKVLWEK